MPVGNMLFIKTNSVGDVIKYCDRLCRTHLKGQVVQEGMMTFKGPRSRGAGGGTYPLPPIFLNL